MSEWSEKAIEEFPEFTHQLPNLVRQQPVELWLDESVEVQVLPDAIVNRDVS